MSTDSAVTAVTPTAARTPRATSAVTTTASAPAATKTAGRGRPALILKGGIAYKDAKAAAQGAIRTAKSDLSLGKAELKNREKIVAGDTKAITNADKGVTVAATALLRTPKDPAAKQAVVEAKNTLKACQTALKAANKDVAAQAKLVTKLETALAKAQDGLAKIESQKAASLN